MCTDPKVVVPSGSVIRKESAMSTLRSLAVPLGLISAALLFLLVNPWIRP